MTNVTFITGNQGKADFMAKYLGIEVAHRKLDLDEIQSLDLKEVVEYKARQAYKLINSAVLVEDVGLVFEGMGKLPGPFIKWFEKELGLKTLCRMVDLLQNRNATDSICFAYFDGQKMELFLGELLGRIAENPTGTGGFGFDPIFIPYSSQKTLAQMNEAELELYSLRTTTVYPQLRVFLASLDKK